MPEKDSAAPEPGLVELYWLPLGAGDTPRLVHWSGRLYEAIAARGGHRTAQALYHSALQVRLGADRFTIEMAPVWATPQPGRGVVGEGAVGSPLLGRWRLFRYEVRAWRDGIIPDLDQAVDSPQRMSSEAVVARRLLALVREFPTVTWGRDELGAGEMWNSNSLTAWLLARSGHALEGVHPPLHGRAPGWQAGLVVAGREWTLVRSQPRRAP